MTGDFGEFPIDRTGKSPALLALLKEIELKIRCHSIQRAACVEALAENGKVFSVRQSFNQFIEHWDGTKPIDVVLEGINAASTFDGFCQKHDSLLFSKAEQKDRRTQKGLLQAYHLRSIALIYCRQRYATDFMSRMAELMTEPLLKQEMKRRADHNFQFYEIFRKLHFGSIVGIMQGLEEDRIFGCRIRFNRNLQVSCCGCLQYDPADIRTVIGFNLVSRGNESELVLTTFKVVAQCLVSFEGSYGPGTIGYQEMLNDLAFSKCQEPLIAPSLWKSLTSEERSEISLSLRHPQFRSEQKIAKIIKISSHDIRIHQSPGYTIDLSLDGNHVLSKFERTSDGTLRLLSTEVLRVPVPNGLDPKSIIAVLEAHRPEMKGKLSLGTEF